MNTVQLLREAGPEGPALTPTTRNAARAALLDEIDAAAAGRRRMRMPSRKVRWRVGIGAVAVAASWAAAVVIAAPDELGPLPDRVRLVAAEPLVFPLSLEPVPPGWTVGFDGDPGFLRATYGDGGEDGVAVAVWDDEPEFSDVTREDEVDVDGREGLVITSTSDYCDTTPDGAEFCELRDDVRLVVQRHEGQWVTVGGPTDPARLVEIAESLVDRPQPVPLQVSVAPEGFSVLGFKDDRILTLPDDDHEQHTLTVHLPYPEDVIPADRVRESIMGPVGPQLDVTVNGRPAQLVRVELGPVDSGWYLQAQFEDGTTFVVQAPESFTQGQVLQVAESVVYTP